jgi:hypothetical protein
MRMLVGLFVIGATVSSLGACSHSNTAYGELSPERAVAVHVQNQNFLDVDVYAVAEGTSTRLGTVTGNSSRNFVVSDATTGQDFSLIATPIGGAGRASTGNITVSGGQTVDFRIGTVLSQSTVFIH